MSKDLQQLDKAKEVQEKLKITAGTCILVGCKILTAVASCGCSALQCAVS